jgi:phosphoribosylformylglycinamidine synthase
MIAVSEAARNIVCSGGEPAAITNCLNFGNPYNPEVYWQFVQAIKGMGAACAAFDTPVTGGNVSFYNQNGNEAVYPTPTIGMVGVVEQMERVTGIGFQAEGDVILLLGVATDDIHSSQYLQIAHDIKVSAAPYFNLDEELKLQHAVRELIKKKLVHSAHDVSDGGLFITLLEKAMVAGMGYEIETDSSLRKDAFLFGEGQGRVVLTCKSSATADIEEICSIHGIPLNVLGSVGGQHMIIDGEDLGTVEQFRSKYDNALQKHMDQELELVS